MAMKQASSYSLDRKWSDRFIPQIKALIGPFLLQESEPEVDMKQATDLVILKADDVAIACRVRRHGYADKYPDQFTVRAHRDSGARTELSKIMNGWADLMFYGHASEDETMIDKWMLLNMDQFRDDCKNRRGEVVWQRKDNGDGTQFIAFDANSFDPKIMVARG